MGPGVRTGAPVSAAGTRTCVSARSASAGRTASKVRARGSGCWVPGAASLWWHVCPQAWVLVGSGLLGAPWWVMLEQRLGVLDGSAGHSPSSEQGQCEVGSP